MAGEIANRERPPVRVTLRRERERPLRAGEPVSTEQRAEIELPESALERLWNAEALERLARSYWAFLERISLRLLRVRYYPDGRAVTLLGLLPLLRFHAPDASGCRDRPWRERASCPQLAYAARVAAPFKISGYPRIHDSPGHLGPDQPGAQTEDVGIVMRS